MCNQARRRNSSSWLSVIHQHVKHSRQSGTRISAEVKGGFVSGVSYFSDFIVLSTAYGHLRTNPKQDDDELNLHFLQSPLRRRSCRTSGPSASWTLARTTMWVPWWTSLLPCSTPSTSHSTNDLRGFLKKTGGYGMMQPRDIWYGLGFLSVTG